MGEGLAMGLGVDIVTCIYALWVKEPQAFKDRSVILVRWGGEFFTHTFPDIHAESGATGSYD